MPSTIEPEENPVTSYVSVNHDTLAEVRAASNEEDQWADDMPSRSYMMKRVAIGVVGVLLGLLTLVPNAMIASLSTVAAHVGIFASVCFVAGGLMGARISRPIWLLPGALLQLVVFLITFMHDGA